MISCLNFPQRLPEDKTNRMRVVGSPFITHCRQATRKSWEGNCSKKSHFTYYRGPADDPISIPLRGLLAVCQNHPHTRSALINYKLLLKIKQLSFSAFPSILPNVSGLPKVEFFLSLLALKRWKRPQDVKVLWGPSHRMESYHHASLCL